MRVPDAVAEVFAPVEAPTTFEETVERLGTAIRLGLLAAGERLPPERELAEQFGISRSTLRQALRTLVQSGHLTATRGRSGGTFVAQAPPLTTSAGAEVTGQWRDVLDWRIALETGAVVLAADRAPERVLERMAALVETMDASLERFPAYRRADVRFHIAIAEATGSKRLVSAMTEVQGAMGDLIAQIAHPPEVLQRSNNQHRRLVELLRRGETARAVRLTREHLEGTEHIIAGLMR